MCSPRAVPPSSGIETSFYSTGCVEWRFYSSLRGPSFPGSKMLATQSLYLFNECPSDTEVSAWKVQDGPGGFESEAAAWRHKNDVTTVTARLVTADDSTTTVVRHPDPVLPSWSRTSVLFLSRNCFPRGF